MPIPRSYSGLEIDMLDVGDADCILVSRWFRGGVKRVLIDGGEKKHGAYIKAFLRRRRAFHLHHVVCSHLHRDHAAGLVQLVKDEELTFDCAWVHKPEEKVDLDKLNEALEALIIVVRDASLFFACEGSVLRARASFFFLVGGESAVNDEF